VKGDLKNTLDLQCNSRTDIFLIGEEVEERHFSIRGIRHKKVIEGAWSLFMSAEDGHMISW